MKLVKQLVFKSLGDDRGCLVALEGNEIIPFDIQRVYYIYSTAEGVSRGFHAHKKLKQVMVCVHGKCRLNIYDGSEHETVWLDSPERGILIEGFVWREMHDFSENCVLLVLASDHYDEDDYIRDYSEFEKLAKRY